MIITAKFNGKCTLCGGYIKAGEQCQWKRGIKGISHIADCSATSNSGHPEIESEATSPLQGEIMEMITLREID